MNEKCIVCKKVLNKKKIHLCKEHTEKALECLKNEPIENPSFEHHCGICGKWQNRVIINYPKWLYLCDICINIAKINYKL